MSLQNKYLLPLDHRPVGPVNRLLCSHGVPLKQPPPTRFQDPVPARFHIGRHILLANSLIQLLFHQTCHSLRLVHHPFQVNVDRNCVTARELSYSQITLDSTYRNADRQPSHGCWQTDNVSPFSLLNYLLMELPSVVVLHTSQQTIFKNVTQY